MGDERTQTPPLWDRYVRERGRVHLTGIQALVRLPLAQIRRDRAAGHRVGGLISGYPGSPLGGLDQAYRGVAPLLQEHDVRFVAGLNEELAASAVGGTQLIDLFPHSRFDGIVGIWFGKAPGLDRALDALRHCNFMGTSRYGGAVAVVGDDPFCKSSSLPSHSGHALAHAFLPLLVPADAADVLALGLHGFSLSRYAGLYAALRVVADVADAGSVFELPEPTIVELPKFEIHGCQFQKQFDPRLLPPHVNRIEEQILYERFEAVRRYAHANDLDRIRHRSSSDRIGFIASGHLYRELETAFRRMGLEDGSFAELGLRVLQLRLVHPIEPRRLREFADGLHEVIVVDERGGFLEEQVRSTLFNTVDPPFVLGQYTESGEPWLARRVEVTSETLALDLAPHLVRRLGRPELESRIADLRACERREPVRLDLVRKPHFCSGCPHSSSTQLPEGSVAGGGIGCHTMALLMDRDVQFIGAMGTEGASWIGLHSFVDTPHLFQNLGDGTYFHSGRLAVRACVESGARMTFKLLYNGAIAMTGGQTAVGVKTAADVVRDLLGDGVRRVVVATTDPELHGLAALHPRVECVAHDEFDRVMRTLRKESGVTVAVFDAPCANQKQRLERRGLLPQPDARIVINEDVCDGCGDCGRRSTCASLRPTETPLGPKTRVHESSCSDDRACLRGDCPSFLVVRSPRGRPGRPDEIERWIPELPDPLPCRWRGDRFGVFMVGVGSTGVVTIDALLVRAAELDGLYALHLDQTGLAQRGGKVTSHCIIGRSPLAGSPRVGWGEADALLAFDPVGAADGPALRALDPKRTLAVAHSSVVPTADWLARPENALPHVEELVDPLREQTLTLDLVRAEALASAAVGEARCANTLLLGFALQKGLIPVRPTALERAILENGVAVEPNLAALRLGRAAAVDPELEATILADAEPPTVADEGDPARARHLYGALWDSIAEVLPGDGPSGVAHHIAGFAADLQEFQNRAWGERYLRALLPLALAVSIPGKERELLSVAGRELYRLMAYKDEYEVARLLLRGPFRRWLERHTTGRIELSYRLHPPLLRALGLGRKLALGRWAEPLLRGLLPLRRLRGTPLDPFGRTRARRADRELIDWYEALIASVTARLEREPDADSKLAGEILAATAGIRGFENVRLERIEPTRRRVDTLLERFLAD